MKHFRSFRYFLLLVCSTFLWAKPDSSSTHLIDQYKNKPLPLYGSETEIRRIQKMLGGRVFVNGDATEGRFKKEAPKAQILHLATHAELHDTNPLYSKLYFQGPGNHTDDGFLQPYELFNIKLNADLVVLSACNTGMGQVLEGEGVMSLARGFMYAGCPSMVTTLWSVDDKSSSIIMQDFYRHIKNGFSKNSALRQAKLNFIRSNSDKKAAPYFWAGFVGIGDPAPIPKERFVFLKPLPLFLTVMISALLLWNNRRSVYKIRKPFQIQSQTFFHWLVQVCRVITSQRVVNLKRILVFFILLVIGCFFLFSGKSIHSFITPILSNKRPQNPAEDVSVSICPDHNKARIFEEAQQYDSAYVHFERAAAIYRAQKQWRFLSITIQEQADCYLFESRLNEALDLAIATLSIADSLPNVGLRKFVHTLFIKGLTLHKLARYDEALIDYQKVDSLNQWLPDSEKFDPLRLENYIALVLKNNGATLESLVHFEEHIQNIKKIDPDNINTLSRAYQNTAGVFSIMGRYGKSLEYLNQASRLMRTDSLKFMKDLGYVYDSIGKIHRVLGDYERALMYFNLGLRCKKLGYPPNASGSPIAQSLHLIASTYLNMDKPDQAEPLLQQSLETRLQIFGEHHIYITSTLAALSQLQLKQKDYAEALYTLNRCIALRKRYKRPNSVEFVNYNQRIGQVLISMGKDWEAKKSYEAGLEILNNLPHKNAYYFALIHMQLAELEYRHNNSIGAIPHLDAVIKTLSLQSSKKQGINGSQPVIAPEFLIQAFSLKAQILVEDSNRDSSDALQKALNYYLSGLDVIDQIRWDVISEMNHYDILIESTRIYRQAMELAISLFEDTNDTKYLNTILRLMENSKSAVLKHHIHEAKIQQFAGISPANLQKEADIKAQIRYIEKLFFESAQRNGEQSNQTVSSYQEKIAVLKQKYDVLMRTFQQQNPTLFKLRFETTPLTIDKLEKNLITDSTGVVEYFLSDTTVFLFFMSKDTTQIRTIDLPTDFESTVWEFRKSIIEKDWANYCRLGYFLYQILLEPIESNLTPNLVIIPDGILCHLPFEALLTAPMENPHPDYKHCDYLLNDRNIHYAFSAALLLDMQNMQKPKHEIPFMGFAPVTFNQMELEKKQISQKTECDACSE